MWWVGTGGQIMCIWRRPGGAENPLEGPAPQTLWGKRSPKSSEVRRLEKDGGGQLLGHLSAQTSARRLALPRGHCEWGGDLAFGCVYTDVPRILAGR